MLIMKTQRMKQKQWKPFLSSILAAPKRRQCEFVSDWRQQNAVPAALAMQRHGVDDSLMSE
jgi:hypothetical protein